MQLGPGKFEFESGPRTIQATRDVAPWFSYRLISPTHLPLEETMFCTAASACQQTLKQRGCTYLRDRHRQESSVTTMRVLLVVDKSNAIVNEAAEWMPKRWAAVIIGVALFKNERKHIAHQTLSSPMR